MRQTQTADVAVNEESRPPAPERCWALIERIEVSEQLCRAPRLREFLRYVAQRSLKEGSDQIHEQEIGAAVFGRPGTYDTGSDSIVRATASELRKRVDAYFDYEGRHETVLMEIPRGAYVPTFRFRSVRSNASAEPIPQSTRAPNNSDVVPLAATRTFKFSAEQAGWLLGGMLLVALSTCCTMLWLQKQNIQHSLEATNRSFYPWRYQHVVAQFWSPFVDSENVSDIVLPDASLADIQTLSKTSISLNEYLNHSYLSKFEGKSMGRDMHTAVQSYLAESFVTHSTLKMAQRITSLDPLNRNMHLYFSQEYIPALINKDNVILFGVPFANPWMELFDGRLNFDMSRQYDRVHEVTNRIPNANEEKIYQSNNDLGYCVIAYLPNPNHSGKTLLIQGTQSEAWEGCGDILFSENQLSDLQHDMHVAEFPYFEALFKTRQIPGSPIRAELVAYRTYTNVR